jgi:tRNA A-37 threonylcarbamoyl transferase component Bud32
MHHRQPRQQDNREGPTLVESSVSAAHDPERMRVILQQHLQPSPGGAVRVQECRIANTRRRDGSRGTIEYALRLEDAATGRVRDQIVTGVTFGGDRTRRVWESICQTAAARTEAAEPSALPNFGYVPELDLLLQVFPHDVRLPALARLMAGPPPELASVLLSELGAVNRESLGWTADVVQYRVDMRAIVRLTAAAVDSDLGQRREREFYAKVYRDSEQGRRAYRFQADLHERASGSGELLVVAKPIVYDETLRTLVTEAVPGMSFSKIISRDRGSVDAVRSVARAIATFHHLDVDAPPRPVADEMIRLHEAREFLASSHPELADDVSAMVDSVAAGLAGAPSTLIHGDLKPDHIRIDGDRVALIDFDLLARADPIIDVAHLVAFLGKPQERSRSRREETADFAQEFVDEYFAAVPESWRVRLPLYHAMTSIHKAAGLSRRGGAERQHLIAEVLREGQEFLAGAGDGTIPSYKRRLTRSVVR